MFHPQSYSGTKEEQYELLIKQLDHLTVGVEESVSNLANASALLGQFLNDINWVGFYLLKDESLYLGPFQGLPACTHIPLGRGVCGTAASTKITQRVADVHQFPGHIACDAASLSEIVIPMIKDNVVIGVLDIDSPILNRFDEIDEKYLTDFIKVLLERI